MLMSDPLWTTRSFVGFYLTTPFIFNNLVSLSLIHNAFGKLYPLLSQPCSAFEPELITSEDLVYDFKMPQWVEPMPSLIGVNSKVFTSRTLLVFCQIKFQNYNFIEHEK